MYIALHTTRQLPILRHNAGEKGIGIVRVLTDENRYNRRNRHLIGSIIESHTERGGFMEFELVLRRVVLWEWFGRESVTVVTALQMG